MNYTQYTTEQRLRTLSDLLVRYLSTKQASGAPRATADKDNRLPDVWEDVFGSRQVLAAKLWKIDGSISKTGDINGQTLGNRLDKLSENLRKIDALKKEEERVREWDTLWYQKKYYKLWNALITFVNAKPLRGSSENEVDVLSLDDDDDPSLPAPGGDTSVDDVWINGVLGDMHPEAWLFMIQKEILPAAQEFALAFYKAENGEALIDARGRVAPEDLLRFLLDSPYLEKLPDDKLEHLKKYHYQLPQRVKELKKSCPIGYFLAISIGAIKGLALQKTSYITREDLENKLRDVKLKLMDVLTETGKYREAQSALNLRLDSPDFGTQLHSSLMLAFVLYYCSSISPLND